MEGKISNTGGTLAAEAARVLQQGPQRRYGAPAAQRPPLPMSEPDLPEQSSHSPRKNPLLPSLQGQQPPRDRCAKDPGACLRAGGAEPGLKPPMDQEAPAFPQRWENPRSRAGSALLLPCAVPRVAKAHDRG